MNCYVYKLSRKGFTLVEMMMSLAISTIIAGVIFVAYQAQQKSMSTQEAVGAMQQDLRAAAILLERDLREAGTDPYDPPAGAGIQVATINTIAFTRDISGDLVNPNEADGDLNDANENVVYSFLPGEDTDNDGIVDGGGAAWSASGNIGRNTGGGLQTIAPNIDAVEFNYILENGNQTLAPPNPNLIRGVQVSILARSDRHDPSFVGTGDAAGNLTYQTGSGAIWSPPRNDGFRRRLSIVTIFCRNLEL
jgi:type IV pilus assembly protein PilW